MDVNERRFNPGRKDVLLSEQRQARWQPAQFLTKFVVPAGSAVLDLGCGPGFWTLPLADIVGPAGTVWAADVSQEMLDTLAGRRPPAQVRMLLTELPRIDLPDDSVDLVWIAFVAHEVHPFEAAAGELRRVGRRLALLEWRPDAASDMGPPRPHRLTSQQVIAALVAAGFPSAKQTWQDADNYLVEA